VLFNSFIFLFAFLPATLVAYWSLRRPRWRLTFLALASYVFYAYWDWRYVPLLIGSTSVDWLAGRAIARSDNGRRRKLLLAAALGVNLAVLGYFKYRGFFAASLDGLSSLVRLGRPLPALSVVLPIGISFYTFNAMSYVIDLYRRKVTPAEHYIQFAAFVAMFPHVVAGPIVRYSDIDDQLRRLEPRLSAGLAASGLYFLACGLVKKLLIADALAPHVNRLFGNVAHLGLVSGWAAAVGYALQLYFDFSGYSDMAVGLAFLLGFRFPQNFDSPYKAVNISDFWRRWHMSLSFWFRDYVFISLGGSQAGRVATLRNLLITMALVGLWHGAAWTFVVWGLVQGAYLAVHAVARQARLTPPWRWLNRTLTFVAVIAAWVVFRAPTLHAAGQVYRAMAGLNGVESLARIRELVGPAFAALVIAGLIWVNVAPNTWEVTPKPRVRYAVLLGLGLGAAILAIGRPSPFLYFQF
jgi:alginate O-acetyltransferase complex protein AlgI